ncbi:alkyl/aryl-sulfatase [Paenibacillus sp. L3-i20]|uniref:alkyl/aryl-sulfatase n=1 Tax=Paenibacillus sp. L3-i20 TaxID=2905833 RepID=UPI001EDDB79F|nr:alkyl sulfatase dimerization domain-containing protein [Paenibacillus sp. L3-i20]GKU79385.1 alkyl sulfatase [Paenibacillus sp. L3-i20]
MTSSKITSSLPASTFTKAENEAVYKTLNFEDKQDFEDANRGFIAPLQSKTITNNTGEIVWDIEKLAFLDDPIPDTVNPSLWRNSQLHAITGLFKVVEGVYQVRGQSIVTIFIIEGKEGVIVIDTLAGTESAKAAMELYYSHRPQKPVTAIIISQSHADHFAGIQAVLEFAANPNIPIIAPEHFTKEALSENVLLGTIMTRRAQYQFGNILPVNTTGSVSVGIGPVLGSGTFSFVIPTVDIVEETKKMEIDGITFRFLLTPNTEAPAEMHFYIQDYKALFVSENANKSMHQLYTLRGAKTRDALLWATALDKTIDLFEHEEIDALLMIHAWPVWGKENGLHHLKLQRDLYKYMHDQTIRLANHGYTMDEIAETITLPDKLNQYWGNRGYYGTLKHNSKGIYNFYLGFYNGHPSDLDPLPQVEGGKKYVQYMGGASAIIQQAKADYEKGEYRWVAQVCKHIVMADPDHTEAKQLLANALEQLGYQAESANWRNIYLAGALELRNGVNREIGPSDTSGLVEHMPITDFLTLLTIRVNGPKAEGIQMTMNVTITNENEQFVMHLENSVLFNKADRQDNQPNVTLVVDRDTFYAIMLGSQSIDEAIASGKLEMTGEQHKVNEFISLLDQFEPLPNIVTP